MISVDEIVKEIEKRTGVSREEILKKIEQKQKELSGLISEEGAAHLVARELGINLLEEIRRKLEIKNIIPGMRNVNVVGRVFRVSRINGFKRADGSEGKVANFFIGDSSGFARVVLWDKQVKILEEYVKLGDVVQVFNGFARENIFGDIEISLGKYGGVKVIEDSFNLPSVEELNRRFFSPQRIRISEVKPGVFEIQGNIVQIFRSNYIFNVCPVCENSVKEVEGKFKCQEHGEIEAKPQLVISTIIDDGTGNLRVVFFRDLAEKISGVSASELLKIEEDKRYEYLKKKLLGKEVIVSGRIKKNKIFDRLELIANAYKHLNISEESKRLAKEVELKLNSLPLA